MREFAKYGYSYGMYLSSRRLAIQVCFDAFSWKLGVIDFAQEVHHNQIKRMLILHDRGITHSIKAPTKKRRFAHQTWGWLIHGRLLHAMLLCFMPMSEHVITTRVFGRSARIRNDWNFAIKLPYALRHPWDLLFFRMGKKTGWHETGHWPDFHPLCHNLP